MDPTAAVTVPTIKSITSGAQVQEGEFVVLAGSTARLEDDFFLEGQVYAALHVTLRDSGMLAVMPDVAFSSPSASDAAVLCRPARGTLD